MAVNDMHGTFAFSTLFGLRYFISCFPCLSVCFVCLLFGWNHGLWVVCLFVVA